MRLRIATPIVTLIFALIYIISPCSLQAQEQFNFQDVMQFKSIDNPVISADGDWIAFSVWPERGDGEARIKQVNGNDEYVIDRGERPQISSNGEFAAAIVKPPFLELENAGRNGPKNSLAVLNLENGERQDIENVTRFEFSNDGNWLVVSLEQAEGVESDNPHIGSPRKLINLQSDDSLELPFVNAMAIDSTSNYFVYSTVDTVGDYNALYAINLDEGIEPVQLLASSYAYYNNFSWDEKRSRLALTASEIDTVHDYRLNDASIVTWHAFDGDPEIILTPDDVEEGFRLRSRNNLTWTYDGERLFYGVKNADMVALDEREEPSDSLTADNMFDLEHILNQTEGKVWHWDDPLIKTHEKQTFNNRKSHLYMVVHHLNEGRSVQLATKSLPYVIVSHNTGHVIGSSDLPYRQLITYDGRYRDYFLIDLETGGQTQFLTQQRFGASLSANGDYAAWFDGEDWNIMSSETGQVRNLTEELDVPFADEDNDRPQPSGGYGIAGWTDGDRSVLIYDKYDIWQFDTSADGYRSITDGKGREEQRIYRIRDLNPDRHTFSRNERLLLTMFDEMEKNYGFYESRIGRTGISELLEEEMKFTFVAKAENSDAILFTKEKYDLYPNLWISDGWRFRSTSKLTNLYDDLKERWNWGHAELIDWLDVDGKKTQGIVVYPDDYNPDQTYPVFIYFYERFSQRLYDFNHPVTNHRPNIAQYVSDGYVFFMPDVWFDIPQPGYSGTKSIVPGVHKLVKMGVADPDAIGLHGHSWSGYLAAHMVTETDMFAAAVAGAPVGNMTSAYSGIRWGTGLARQFQYEQTQSRLGVSLWENPNPYIENSPVFFADRINTPIMIQHGDADDAVPWYQSIELYLALRRNGKESVFLHYYDEPHHLRKFANRLDYAIKMKEYMDHYLKGIPAPAWIEEGIPYLGD